MNKILVVNPFGIGDVIFSMYLVEALKRQLPQSQVGFLGNERTIELLRMNPSISVCHEFNRDEFRALRQKSPVAFISKLGSFAGDIKKERYDAMFDLSLGREFAFAGAFLGIRKRIGFDYKNRGFGLTHKIKLESYKDKHVVDWQLDLLHSLGLRDAGVPAKLPFQISADARNEASAFLAANGASEITTFFSVSPGGGKSWGQNARYKQWRPERFAQVIKQRGGVGRVLLIGDRGEAPLLNVVNGLLGRSAIVVAGLRLEVVCALLGRSRFFLGNDGGLLHLANALGVRTISIYGPVDEVVYGPYGEGVDRSVLIQDVPCRPCYQKFQFPPCEHHRRCLDDLSVEKVSAALCKI